MRTIHRITMMFAVLFALYLGATGSLIQAVDLKTLLSHAPATDLNQQSIREGAAASISHFRAARYRFHIPNIGIPSAAASITTPAIINSTFNASIVLLPSGSCAQLDTRFPAAEPSSAGPVHQTSTLPAPAA